MDASGCLSNEVGCCEGNEVSMRKCLIGTGSVNLEDVGLILASREKRDGVVGLTGVEWQ